MTTGERIRARRKALGRSAEWLAESIGVSYSTIYRYENGFIEKCPGDVLVSIAEALNTTPAYLMGWEDENPAPISESELDKRILSMLSGLSDSDYQKVLDYVALLKAAHKD